MTAAGRMTPDFDAGVPFPVAFISDTTGVNGGSLSDLDAGVPFPDVGVDEGGRRMLLLGCATGVTSITIL